MVESKPASSQNTTASAKANPVFKFAAMLALPPLTLTTKPKWIGTENFPKTGGFVVCSNHTSNVDPLTLAHLLYRTGIMPRFLGKDSLFRIPFIGNLLYKLGQIPVYRNSTQAKEAFSAAVAAVEEGKCVVIYPEGTLTSEPDFWPMRGKTGAARVALQTGCPVIPVGQWGPEIVLSARGRKAKNLFRTPVKILVGKPVDLSQYEGKYSDVVALRAATDKILDDITDLVAQLRGQEPPPVRFDPRPGRHGQNLPESSDKDGDN